MEINANSALNSISKSPAKPENISMPESSSIKNINTHTTLLNKLFITISNYLSA